MITNRLIKFIFVIFVAAGWWRVDAMDVEPRVVLVSNASWNKNVHNLINYYIKSKNFNRNNLVLIVRREATDKNLFYLCLLSKSELRDAISQKPEIPDGYARVNSIEVLLFAKLHAPFFALTGTKHPVDWYEHRGLVTENGHEITTNVEPFITVFSLDGDKIKKIGTLVADPTSSILPSLPIE